MQVMRERGDPVEHFEERGVHLGRPSGTGRSLPRCTDTAVTARGEKMPRTPLPAARRPVDTAITRPVERQLPEANTEKTEYPVFAIGAVSKCCILRSRCSGRARNCRRPARRPAVRCAGVPSRWRRKLPSLLGHDYSPARGRHLGRYAPALARYEPATSSRRCQRSCRR